MLSFAGRVLNKRNTPGCLCKVLQKRGGKDMKPKKKSIKDSRSPNINMAKLTVRG